MSLNFLQDRQKKVENSNRHPFMRDKARILHSAFFRRLQSKKQILDQEVSDFGRTRLTHSLETAQISVGIREALFNSSSRQDIKDNLPDVFCIEAAALAHDLGHPPNGHGGEEALNYVMLGSKYNGFESNAQTFRIANKLGEYDKEYGLNLTRATILGFLKYPVLYSEATNSKIQNQPKKEHYEFIKFSNFKPAKCIFDSEKSNLEWLLEPFSEKEQYLEFSKKQWVSDANGKSQKYFNFFASIVNLADDIAYGIHDLEDAVALKLISIDDWNELESDDCFAQLGQFLKEKKLASGVLQECKNNLFLNSSYERKKQISSMVNLFIENTKVIEIQEFTEPVFKFNVCLDDPLKNFLEKIQKFIYLKVIQRRENQLSDFKLQYIIVKLFNCIKSDTKRFLPIKYQKTIAESKELKERIICDYIAGMTDRYLLKLDKTLFAPDFGSIFDKI